MAALTLSNAIACGRGTPLPTSRLPRSEEAHLVEERRSPHLRCQPDPLEIQSWRWLARSGLGARHLTVTVADSRPTSRCPMRGGARAANRALELCDSLVRTQDEVPPGCERWLRRVEVVRPVTVPSSLPESQYKQTSGPDIPWICALRRSAHANRHMLGRGGWARARLCALNIGSNVLREGNVAPPWLLPRHTYKLCLKFQGRIHIWTRPWQPLCAAARPYA